ncbi:hypothetical protein ACODT3_00575 [Streptomyces sp. 4.24]|uniref:hypothetical protein n=1 Tax=Streptomyces tritrimontium TaxID=3406573 RepID=UPI003BB60E12
MAKASPPATHCAAPRGPRPAATAPSGRQEEGPVFAIELLTAKARENGWTLLFPDRHPHTGGDHQHAAHLESRDGFEIELITPHTA